MNMDGVRHIRDRFNVPVSDADIEKLPYITFPEGSEEHTYLHAQRQKTARLSANRQPNFTEKLELPSLQDFGALLEEQSKEISTTIAFVRALNVMLKNKSIKDRLVPIMPTKRVLRYGRSVPSDWYLQPERSAVHPAGPRAGCLL